MKLDDGALSILLAMYAILNFELVVEMILLNCSGEGLGHPQCVSNDRHCESGRVELDVSSGRVVHN